MSWRTTKQGMFTNRTGCEPCKEIANLRSDIGGQLGNVHGHLGNLHNNVNNITSTLTSHNSSINELYSMFKDTDPATTFTYKETGDFKGGPISVEFYMATKDPNAVLGPLYKFKIDNNGKGYLSLSDLFQVSTPSDGSAPNNLNDKIKELIEQSNIGTVDYFKNSLKNADGSSDSYCYTISAITIKFNSGQSYVRDPEEMTQSGLGDPWGAPVFFEIGGNRYPNDNQSYTPNSTAEPFKIKGADKDNNKYTVQINQVRIIGEGQGSTNIRGSCIFVIYNMIDSAQSYGDGWASKPSFITFSNRRIVSGGYLWSGHFGICTDYDDDFKNNGIISSPYKIGNVPTAFGGGNSIFIPNYQGASGEDLPTGKSIEYLFIDAWIELEENTLTGAVLKIQNIGYPVLAIGAIIPKRFYLKNVVCFSYQTMNPESKGLVCINSSYIHSDTVAPIDTFIENCTFAARNFNSSVGNPTPTARSFVMRNGDKLSLMTSTFHGNMDLNVNKLAAYNCYCLAVGDPVSSTDAVNYNMVLSQPDSTQASGYHGIATNSRIILQNMIYVTHLDKDRIQALDPSGNSNIHKLTDLTTQLQEEQYRYDSSGSLYPIKLGYTTENIFISNSMYYGVMMSSSGPPTFSAMNLNTENITQHSVPVYSSSGPPQFGNVL